MTTPWPVPTFGQIIDVEDRHVEEWRRIAERTGDWLHMHHFVHETPTEARQRRTSDWGGLSWETAVATPPPHELPRLSCDLVLVSPADTVLIAVALEFGQCLQLPDEPAVAVNLARSASSAADGAALAVMREMPSFVRTATGSVDHVVADVCTANTASLHLMQRAGWQRVGSGSCEYHHPRVDCRERSEVFCSHP